MDKGQMTSTWREAMRWRHELIDWYEFLASPKGKPLTDRINQINADLHVDQGEWRALHQGPVIWISSEMLEVARSAAKTLPPGMQVHEADLLATDAFYVLEEPLNMVNATGDAVDQVYAFTTMRSRSGDSLVLSDYARMEEGFDKREADRKSTRLNSSH